MRDHIRLIRNPLALAVAAAITCGTGVGNVAFAQAARGQTQDQPRATGVDEVTVTGSRIRRDDFGNPQPTTVVTGELMNDLGMVNLGDMMAQMPSNIGSYTPTAKAGGNGGDNSSFPLNVFNGLNLANLRGLNPSYGSRTLTLLDSRRHVPTNQGDGVDLNMIPTILIDRMEVVTGGASASYGSGAIAGVVNILMDRDLEGGKTQVDIGSTAEGDGDDLHYGFAWGSQLGESGHLVVAVEGQKMDPIEYCIQTREWCARGVQIQTNSGYTSPANTEPNYVTRANVHVNRTMAGVFPRLGVQVNDAATAVSPYDVGAVVNASNPDITIGGGGRHIYEYLPLRTNIDRTVVYSVYTHDINEDLNFFVEGSLGNVESYSPQIPFDLVQVQVMHDNYYLNQLSTNPCAGLAYTFNAVSGLPSSNCKFSKDFHGQSNTANETTTDLARLAFGFSGRFGESSWTWDTYYQTGESDTIQTVHDSRYFDRFNFGMDVVADGNGNPVCRVTRDGLAAYPWFASDPRLADGCQPINIFGTAPLSPEAYAQAYGRIWENTIVDQDMVEFVASGDLFDGFAFGGGPVRAAAGVSWRDESIDNPADELQPEYIRQDYQSQFGESFGGDVEVAEVFGELDIPMTAKLTFQTAVRSSSYTNTAGRGTGVEGQEFEFDITTWKFNGTWAATDWFTLRASQSLDIRAPNFRDLYYAKIFAPGSGFGFCSNPWTGNVTQGTLTYTGDPCKVNLLGGLDLVPEEADTTTFGVVFTPANLNFRFAADYFKIKINDAISQAGGNQIQNCFQFALPEFCDQINGVLLNPALGKVGGFQVIEETFAYATNDRSYNFSGVDLTADWFRDFSFGNISMRVVASHMIEQLVQPTVTTWRDIAGVTGAMGGDWRGAPEWGGQWLTTFTRGSFAATAQARYVGGGKLYPVDMRVGPQDPGYNPDMINSVDNNRTPSYVVWALNGSYSFDFGNTQMELFGSVQNLLDESPPVFGNGSGGTNPMFYDTLGRNYRVGLRLNF